MDIHTLRWSFRRLSSRADSVANRFDELLLARHPEVRSLFEGVSTGEQRRKLVRALALVVRHLEEPHFLQAYLRGLGAIHMANGVTALQYGAVTECLIDALAEVAGSTWTEGERAAWQDALESVVATMIAGASVLAEPVSQAGDPC
jgi:hemoglobin-like flavoprotein